MAVIGELPRGLVALLSLRDSGETPRDLAATAVGTIELSQMYMLQRRELVTPATVVAPAVGANFFTPSVIVPPGELWYVWHYWVACTLAVGEDIGLAPGVNLDGTALTVPLNRYENSFGGGSLVENIRSANAHPFFAGPGSEFGFLVGHLTLTPDVAAGLLITRLRV